MTNLAIGSRQARATAVVATLLIFFAGSQAAAAGPVQERPPDRIAGVMFGGGWRLLPELSTTFLYDSNLYRQEGDADETETGAIIIEPKLAMEYSTIANLLRAGYAGQFGIYDTGGEDDYEHNDVFLESAFNQTGRHRFVFDAIRDEAHDPFGTERTESEPLTLRDVDLFVNTKARGAYTFGAPSATLNVTVAADYSDKSYENNRQATRFLDYEKIGGDVELAWRISPRTGLLLEAQHHEISFDQAREGVSIRDGSEQRARLGLQWFASAKISGRATVGFFRRDNDAEDREDFDSADWEVALLYQPVTYSELSVESSHSTQESYFDQADFIDVTRAGVQWTHNWTTFLQTGLGGYLTTYKFEGFDRDDDFVTALAFLSYSFTRWAGVNLSYDFSDRDSNLEEFDFDRHVARLTFRLAL